MTAIGIPALAWFIQHLINKRDEYEAKTREAEREQDEMRYQQLKDGLQRLELCLGTIKKDLSNKVDEEDCKEKCDNKWNMINHHRHAENGDVVISRR